MLTGHFFVVVYSDGDIYDDIGDGMFQAHIYIGQT